MYVDLSLPVHRHAPGVEFAQWRHEDGARRLSRNTRALPGDGLGRRIANYGRWLAGSRRIRRRDLPEGCFLSNEFYRMSVHQGTHVDAPFHYGPRCEGRPAKKITDVPLDWLTGPALILDVRDCGGTVTAETVRAGLKAALAETGADPGPGWVVLFRTDSDLRVGTPAYFTRSTGVDVGAVDELLDRGVKVMGTDCWSLDARPAEMVERFHRTGDGSALWPTHMHGRRREFIAVEGLARLRDVPAGPFRFSGFPIALADAGAAWCRAVAKVED
ncbi:cyclase family protein [Streptomyces sp. NPDC019443]|uniref:cyclase family protein n=1 Tax=Streptomyces sp. NPDC019443 TaxID=3365061 RepID=UPI0037A6FCCE